MLYKDFLNNTKRCPFCKPSSKQIVKENSNSYLIVSIAPYSKYHLLVIPKRHFENISEISEEENKSMLSLIKNGILLLNKLGLKNYTVLVREGDNSAKSIPHIHYHIIPEVQIKFLDNPENRIVMEDKETVEVVNNLKNLLN